MVRAKPLSGIRVLCLAEQYPGPYATLILADLGADVVLVERPGGDPTRQFPAHYDALNRNKRSAVLDLKSPEGHAAFMRLARLADVILEGYRPGVAARLGIAHERIEEVNPNIVYVSISGFGQVGPLRDRPAHDISYQGLAGLLNDRIGAEDPGVPPQICYADLASGMYAVIASLAGLHARAQSTGGHFFDVSITDCLISWMTTQLYASANGLAEPGIPPTNEPGFGMFTTADGQLVTLSIAHEDWFWGPLCRVLGLDDLATLTIPERAADHAAIRSRLAAEIGARFLSELGPGLDSAGVPWGPALTLPEVVASDHLRARGMLESIVGADNEGVVTHVRQPIGVPGTSEQIGRAVPALGQHTVEVLVEAGVEPTVAEDLAARARGRRRQG